MAKPSVWEELPLPEFAVDLGLPSGRLWADRNVGAARPEAYGDYFMWGSTEPDTNKPCDWAHAPFNGGQEYYDEEYFSANSGTWLDAYSEYDVRLKPEYDAAHAIMGGSWRMPTSYEIQELLDGTMQTVVEVNGILGMRFTAPNGNSIFMPFAGFRDVSEVVGVGSGGYAWSSSLITDSNTSYNLNFNDDGYAYVGVIRCCNGLVVRGVC